MTQPQDNKKMIRELVEKIHNPGHKRLDGWFPLFLKVSTNDVQCSCAYRLR